LSVRLAYENSVI